MSEKAEVNHNDEVENTVAGDVEGTITQVGHLGDGAPTGGVRNTVSGTVTGTVLQAGNISFPDGLRL